MRIFLKSLTLIWFFYSLFALIIPIVVMFAKGNESSWVWYVYMGLKSIPDGVWGLMLDSRKYPNWLTFIYWITLIGAIFLTWNPKQNPPEPKKSPDEKDKKK